MVPPLQRPAITVYCASARGINPDFLAAARIFGEALGESGMNLVYGGGGIGLMGELARSAQKSGAHVTGIITEQFLHLEQGWTGCDEMIVVDSMRERKRQLEDRGAGFAILAGGLGTWEEFFETFVGRVIGRHSKPIGLLNTNGFADPLWELVSHGVDHGFVRSAARELMWMESDPHTLAKRLHTAMTTTVVETHDPKIFLPMHGPQG
ncbi:cytokinin riboside 5'-monophosphate phosphoribohydrolase [Phycisphaerae bacterium]|nr:cytokinin riboside 5'-monophosphate phosphoribohydrolase [Phycisphaerae bacterium]